MSYRLLAKAAAKYQDNGILWSYGNAQIQSNSDPNPHSDEIRDESDHSTK